MHIQNADDHQRQHPDHQARQRHRLVAEDLQVHPVAQRPHQDAQHRAQSPFATERWASAGRTSSSRRRCRNGPAPPCSDSRRRLLRTARSRTRPPPGRTCPGREAAPCAANRVRCTTMNPTDRNTMNSEAIRSIGCVQALANSGCNTCSIAVRRIEVTAVKRLIQQSPATARSTICGGSFDATSPGLSSPSDVTRWILMDYPSCGNPCLRSLTIKTRQGLQKGITARPNILIGSFEGAQGGSPPLNFRGNKKSGRDTLRSRGRDLEGEKNNYSRRDGTS